jgi:hypothetical protein
LGEPRRAIHCRSWWNACTLWVAECRLTLLSGSTWIPDRVSSSVCTAVRIESKVAHPQSDNPIGFPEIC